MRHTSKYFSTIVPTAAQEVGFDTSPKPNEHGGVGLIHYSEGR